ncbi:MAG: phosphate starvation protein PhoH [Planctomycetota bacterium]|nr:MAG: phosphate starvation protein PhoH [Planctomycetota bacterium]
MTASADRLGATGAGGRDRRVEVTIELRDAEEALALCGSHDRNLRRLQERFDVQITARDRMLKLAGEQAPVEQADAAVRRLLDLHRAGIELTGETVGDVLGTTAATMAPGGRAVRAALPAGALGRGGRFRPCTSGQARYLQAIDENEIVFVTGPAGTGKTFLAVLKAVEALKSGTVDKIVLCRPAVEAGERLGFLPGDFQAKVNPYLRPLYDALNALLDVETVRRLIEVETIEVVPLAYMRGRTLERAFIILDEAQNTTIGQIKMFLTRMGRGSRIVVTGDTTQVDLPPGKISGLSYVLRILRPGAGIAFHCMRETDIVRHPLVWRIVRAFEEAEGAAREGGTASPRAAEQPDA